MKILAIPAFSPKNTFSSMKSNTPVSLPAAFNTLNKDTVSFKGQKSEESMCDSFGLLKQDYQENEKNDAYITNYFNTSAKNNQKTYMNEFLFNTRGKQIGFFGDERDLARALQRDSIKTSDFAAHSDAKYNFVKYISDGVDYTLHYDKKTHNLVKASASIRKEDEDSPVEKIEIKPSRSKKGEYVARYQFISDINGERAVEDTYILFDSRMTAKASYTNKYFQYSDGEKETQKFGRSYNEAGLPKSEEMSESEAYTW